MGIHDFFEHECILEIPSDINYWLVRANGGKYFYDFLYNDYIAISDNKITLEMIKWEEQRNSMTGITLENYKKIYNDTYKNKGPQSISHAASRTMQFINSIKIGDLILVPSYRSEEFLLGIVISDIYSFENKNPTWKYGEQYPISNYHKRRDVKWIKKLPRESISDKMYWILSAHQSIFNLNEHSEHINKLLSPIYIKDGKCFGSLKINIEKDININEWYELYEIAQKISGEDSAKIKIKTNVQSPGWLEFITDTDNLPTLIMSVAFLSGVLFTKVQMGKMEILGVIPYFFNEGKIKRESMNIDNDLKKIEVEKRKAELDVYKKENNLNTDITEKLQISQFNVGNLIPYERQKGNSDLLDVEGSEKKKRTK